MVLSDIIESAGVIDCIGLASVRSRCIRFVMFERITPKSVPFISPWTVRCVTDAGETNAESTISMARLPGDETVISTAVSPAIIWHSPHK